MIAGAITALSALPQILRIWKDKSAEDISYRMFGSLSVGYSEV